MKINACLKSLLVGAFATAALAAAAEPSVTVGEVTTGDPWSTITVNYTLGGIDPTVDYKVAFDVTAKDETKGVTNAVAKLASGEYAQAIDTAELFGEAKADREAKVRVSLIAVKPAPKPENLYMIINLTADGNGKYLVTYEDMEVAAANVKFNTDEYKTNKLVLRKVKAGQSYYCHPRSTATLVESEKVPVARDYWIGLFEVTEAQYAKVMGDTSTSTFPAHNLQYQLIRGTGTVAADPTSGSFLGKLSANCQDMDGNTVAGFDLPTETQWEIACRANTTTKFCCPDGEIDNYANWKNGTWGGTEYLSVGAKLPNSWGLYDMHGNVFEWCRDTYNIGLCMNTAEAFNETPGGTSEKDIMRRILRGGCFIVDCGLDSCASSCCDKERCDTDPGNQVGFRLCRMAPAQ